MERDTILFPAGYEPCTRNDGSLSRRTFLTGIGLVCLGLGPFFQACDNAFSREATENTTTRTGSPSRSLLPPIDIAAPAETQTATFALG